MTIATTLSPRLAVAQSRALDEDLPGALQGVVDRLAEVLDCRGVAINLHRPAWDDFEIVAIHAPPDIVSELRGGKVPRRTVEMLLHPQFDVGGAFFTPAGAIDEDDLGGVSAIIPRDDRPEGQRHQRKRHGARRLAGGASRLSQ